MVDCGQSDGSIWSRPHVKNQKLEQRLGFRELSQMYYSTGLFENLAASLRWLLWFDGKYPPFGESKKGYVNMFYLFRSPLS